jgi:hypothetical protein
MGINCKGRQGQTERAVVLQEEEGPKMHKNHEFILIVIQKVYSGTEFTGHNRNKACLSRVICTVQKPRDRVPNRRNESRKVENAGIEV